MDKDLFHYKQQQEALSSQVEAQTKEGKCTNRSGFD